MEEQPEIYKISLVNLRNNRVQIIKIDTEYPDYDPDICWNIINAYKEKDYLNIAYWTFVLIGRINSSEQDKGFKDLQHLKDGTPDFEYSGTVPDNATDFYVEFKNEEDRLSMNQVISFNQLASILDVYILNIRRIK